MVSPSVAPWIFKRWLTSMPIGPVVKIFNALLLAMQSLLDLILFYGTAKSNPPYPRALLRANIVRFLHYGFYSSFKILTVTRQVQLLSVVTTLA
ncbi:hypothetical protein CDL15_Pgr012713 [Punica granatum]|uniref:Uncharacterized protein n=1 Tax=Punica granatum TaxID=22663 RepID=A0A218XFW9_PUNGR|nr:hypothetical protein CDL15_Pgr012713 [Punica granatum]